MNRMLFVLCLSLLSLIRVSTAVGTEFHVSPNGNDSFSGTSEKPFATLERARQAVRDLKTKGPLSEPVFVTLHDGTFRLDKTLSLTGADSGTKACPVTWRAAPGAKPHVSGGRKIGPWTKFNDRIFVADVKGLVTADFFPGDFFVNNVRAQLARTPDFGSYFYTKRLMTTSKPGNPCYGFRYRQEDLGDWITEPDLRIMLYQHWSNSLNKIKSIDRDSNEILFDRTLGHFLPPSNVRYYVTNFFAALDSPGEWYYDRANAKMFYYPRPGEDLAKDDTIAACLPISLIELKGDYRAGKPVAHLVFQGITFEHTRPNFADNYPHSIQGANTQRGAMFAVGMQYCLIENCTFSRLGEHGITLWDGCQNNTIRRNRIYDLGGGGVYLSEAAPRENDDPFMTSHNTVDNNFIHDGGYHFAAACGVFLAGSACYNKILHNEICNFNYTGLHAGWSWSGTDKAYTHHNEFAYNHVHHIGCGVMSDLGGVYFLGISTDTDFHDNHLHDISRYQKGYGGWGIYFDSGSSNILIRNNIVHDTDDGGLHLHCYAYPRGDVVQNNIFAFAKYGELMRNAEMEPDSGLHAELSKNIVYGPSENLYYGGNWKKGSKFSTDYNCFWTTRKEPMNFAGRSREQWQNEGHDTHSIFQDPLFKDAENRDFRLDKKSPVFALGFKPIDMNEIGLYGDADWVDLPGKIKWRPTENATTPLLQSIRDNYESYRPGESADIANSFEEDEKGTIRIVEKEGVAKSKCLKFTDAPGLKWQHNPHMFYPVELPQGEIVSECQLRFEPGTLFCYQWRDYKGAAYNEGPSFDVTPSGELYVAGKKLADIPFGQWVKYRVVCSTGSQANGLWTLSVSIPGQKTLTFEKLQYNKKFKNLSWIGFISNANEKAEFFLDDFVVETKKK